MVANNPPRWRGQRVKHREAVALCVLSSSLLLAGELAVPVLQDVYVRYLQPVVADPVILGVRLMLVVFAFTTSLGAILVDLGGWYFLRGRIPRGRFLVGLGVGFTSLSLANKLSYYTLVYGTPLAFLVPLATSLTGLGILFGLTAHLVMGRHGRKVSKRLASAMRRWRRARRADARAANPRSARSGESSANRGPSDPSPEPDREDRSST